MDTPILASTSASVIAHPSSREILLWLIGNILALSPIIIIYVIFFLVKPTLRKRIKWHKPLMEGDLFIFSTTLASFSLSSVIIKKPGLLENSDLLLTFIVLCVVLFMNLFFVYLDSIDKIAIWCKKTPHGFFDDKTTLIASIAFAVLTLGLSFWLFYNGAY